MKRYLIFLIAVLIAKLAAAQHLQQADDKNLSRTYWHTQQQLIPFRLALPPLGYKPKYIDLDGDGDPDILESMTKDSIPVMWIDDNDNMKYGDLEGDLSDDCLLIDRNKDGFYGGIGDLIIDQVDSGDGNNEAMQLIVDYPPVEKNTIWPNGHYMWVLDTDQDGVFNYINWNTYTLESWAHRGIADFYPDYSGQSMFMKVHAATNRIEDLRLNWENPFLFYDPDHDGLSEMAVRMVDSTSYFNDPGKKKDPQTMRFSGKINWVSISVDMDNDNGPEDQFDYDMTIGFRGGGFNYMDQVHKINMHSLPGTDKYFMDPSWRHLHELIYTDHAHAFPLIFTRGKWNQVYFAYDEDDDCHRWERVEFYDPLDPFKIGVGNKGIDNNPQSDPVGDRGEWDMDNSGKGKLYISKFDGKLHLYGAEWGCWRIDEAAAYYQGWDRRTIKTAPGKFATIKYEDSDGDGFFDKILYDLDGDTTFETIIDLNKLGIDDHCRLIDISHFKYDDYVKLQKKVAAEQWDNAKLAVKIAKQYGLNTDWYAKLQRPSSVQQKYHDGYWLQFYLYKDMEYYFLNKGDNKMLAILNKDYYSDNWKGLLTK